MIMTCRFAKPVGAMRTYLAKLFSGKIYFSLRETFKLITSAFLKDLVQMQVKLRIFYVQLLQEEHYLIHWDFTMLVQLMDTI